MRLTSTMYKRESRQKGAVSLFVVMFATLLIVVITVSFVRLMVDNQTQSTNQTLAENAYDSAQAGVQDAERALLRYETCSANGFCTSIQTNTWGQCNGIMSAELAPASNQSEMPIQQSGDGQTASSIDQAYTCVKVALDTPNVIGNVAEGSQALIPLQGTGTVGAVQVSWFSKADLSSSNTSAKLTFPSLGGSQLPLLKQYNTTTKQGWSPATPSVLRTQLIQINNTNSFTLSDLDNTISNGSGNGDSRTLFLYPTGISGSSSVISNTQLSFDLDGGTNPTGHPWGVSCIGDLSAGGYACTAIISLPNPINSGNNEVAYLRLLPFYNATHFSVSLLNTAQSQTVIPFHNVQPSIDSTGRANDLFSRVQTRVNLINNYLPYPTDAVEVTGNFCKDFAVTDKTSDYAAINSGNVCKP